MQNVSLRTLSIRKKQNFKIVFGLKSGTAVFTFFFPFFFPLLFINSLFLPHFFFSFAGNSLSFTLLGIVFGKAFRILELDERKGRWVVKQDFHGSFWVNVTWFFFPFSPVSLTESCSFWYGLKDLFTLHKLADKVVLGH